MGIVLWCRYSRLNIVDYVETRILFTVSGFIVRTLRLLEVATQVICSGCSWAVERIPHNQDVADQNPKDFFSLSISVVCP